MPIKATLMVENAPPVEMLFIQFNKKKGKDEDTLALEWAKNVVKVFQYASVKIKVNFKKI